MNSKNVIIVCLLGMIIIISCLVYLVSGVGDKIESYNLKKSNEQFIASYGKKEKDKK
jgi:hypothetical protein